MARRKLRAKNPGRRVDPVNDGDDRMCLLLAMKGRSNQNIRQETDLSDGQISYRLRSYEIKRVDYRDGVSPLAKAVDKVASGIADRQLNQHLKTHMGKGI